MMNRAMILRVFPLDLLHHALETKRNLQPQKEFLCWKDEKGSWGRHHKMDNYLLFYNTKYLLTKSSSYILKDERMAGTK